MRRFSKLSAAVAALSLIVATAGVVGASESPRTSASWHDVGQVLADSGPDPSFFTALATLTATSAWAFESTASKTEPIVAWRLVGSTWSKVAFPEIYGSSVVVATRSTRASAYAATSKGALLEVTGATWTLVSKFQNITDIDSTGPGDLWVTGHRTVAPASGGLWHLDGGTWTHSSTRSFGNLDAASDTAIFGLTNTAVEEFNGTQWKGTSLAAFLPAKKPLCQVPGLTDLIALTPTDVWVTAAGNCQDSSGPFRLLHLVRSTWSIAAVRQDARGGAFSAGNGGLWIPTKAFSCVGCTVMLHLYRGQLTQVPLPLPKQGVTIDVIATAPGGSTASIAVGWTLKCENFSCNGNRMRGVILRYGT
jgi:hypothetical protein